METTALPVTLAYNNSSSVYEQPVNEQNLKNGLWIFSLVIRSLAFLLGIFGNGLVIFIIGFRMKKTVNTIWFLSLAIADFTFTLLELSSIVNLALKNHWPFGEPMCKINGFVAIVNLHASVYFLTIISIDRCISVVFPVWSRNHRTHRRAFFVSLGVWILSLALGSPNLHFRKVKMVLNKTMCVYKYSHNKKEAKIIQRAKVISQFILTFAIPFSIITVCYGVIVQRLKRDRLTLSSKPFKVICAMIVAFFVCWFPYHVFSFLRIRVNKDPKVDWVVSTFSQLTFSLSFINSCLNPILYVFMGRDAQKGLKHSILAVFENTFSEETNRNTTIERVTDLSLRSMTTSRLDTSTTSAERQKEVISMNG